MAERTGYRVPENGHLSPELVRRVYDMCDIALTERDSCKQFISDDSGVRAELRQAILKYLDGRWTQAAPGCDMDGFEGIWWEIRTAAGGTLRVANVELPESEDEPEPEKPQ